MSSTRAYQDFRLHVLNGLAVHGYLTTPQLIGWTGLRVTDQAMTKRLQRMRSDGLVEPRLVKIGSDRGLTCWTLSETAIPLHGDGLPYVRTIAQTTARHHLTVAQVAIELHRKEYRVTTERELRLEDRTRYVGSGYKLRGPEDNVRLVRVMPDGRSVRYSDKDAITQWYAAWLPDHRPDIRTHQGVAADPFLDATPTHATAWEIELSAKKTSRLEQKLQWYQASEHYVRVVYLCGSDSIAQAIARVAKDVAPALCLQVEVLEPEYLRACVSRRWPATRSAGLPNA